jgi:glycosyltransferase involved in cell wall biosynthesis
VNPTGFRYPDGPNANQGIRLRINDKMKILWVKAGKLLPVNRGVSIRSYHILRHLAARHEVTLLSYYGGPKDETYEKEIVELFPGAVVVHTASRDSTFFERTLDYLRHLPSGMPYSVMKFTDARVQRILASWIGDHRFDAAVCDFLSASLNFPQSQATPSVLFQHNVEGQMWRRQADGQSNWLKKAVFKFEASRVLRYEQSALGRFRHVIAVSENDRQLMGGITDPSHITVVPTGVDLECYRAVSGYEAMQPLVIFTGDMSYEPNIDAVEYFCHEIWPQVLTRFPKARFRIVGRNPHRRVKRLGSGSVEITGTVPSVIEHLKEAHVFVVPLRMGSGTRLKIYEAMAMGKAVVSTSIGAEGLDVHHDRDILLVDDALNFASAVVMLLRDRELRQRYEREAAKLAEQFDWSKIAEQFAEVLTRVAGDFALTSPSTSGDAGM